MSDLVKFNWQAFDTWAGVKIAVGLVVMLALTQVTGESWLATALAAMFAWIANFPGPLGHRISGMLAFGVGAAALTLVSGQIELEICPNVILILAVGVLGTAALARGMRAFMVGFALICWAIYGPFQVATTSVPNVLLAIAAGTGIVILLNAIGSLFEAKSFDAAATQEPAAAGPSLEYIVTYAITVGVVLAVTAYYGWVELKTDPTLMAGGAFFVIGFDVNKTWTAGIGRVMGLVAGAVLGLLAAHVLGTGLVLDSVMIAACGLSFAAVGVHPGAWMFFFMIFVDAT